MMRALVLAAVAFAMSGCFLFEPGCWNTGVAPADWTQAGLFRSMPPPGVHGNETLALDGPGPGFDVANASLDALVGAGNWSLTQVAWAPAEVATPGADFIPSTFALTPDGTITSYILARFNASVGEVAARFLANVTDANAAQRAAWVQSFKESATVQASMRSGTDAHEDWIIKYAVNVARINVQGAWDHNEAAGSSPAAPEPGGWLFLINYAEYVARSSVASKADYVLRVDAADHVTFTEENALGPGSVAGFRARLNATFADVGLPSPTAPDGAFRMQRACT